MHTTASQAAISSRATLTSYCRVLGMALSLGILPTVLAAQQSTTILIRVTAHDAKIIGSGVGGARVTVRDYETGVVLAEGIQEGSTGDTRAIMVTPRERGATVYDTEGAAGFLAQLNLSQPTMVEIIAEGPLGTPQALQRASKTMLAVPGQNVLGEGIAIELLGFTVELESPSTGAALVAGIPFPVTASVTMLCGCPTEPGGMWDSDQFQVIVRVLDAGSEMARQPLGYAGIRNMYTTTLTLPHAGRYELQVLALDPDRGNFGRASQAFDVKEPR